MVCLLDAGALALAGTGVFFGGDFALAGACAAFFVAGFLEGFTNRSSALSSSSLIMIASPSSSSSSSSSTIFFLPRNGQPERIRVSGGFAEVSDRGLTVLAEGTETAA